MINLRYHIVSITAVFLALGIGLLFGAAFIDRATVEVLDRNLAAIADQNRDLERDIAQLRDRVGAAEAADRELREQGIAQLVAGQLEGVPVVVLAVRGVDEADVRATADAVVAAGAQLGGVLWLTGRLALDDESEVADLAAALQSNQSDPARLRASLARRFGTMLAAAAEPITTEPPVDPEQPVDTTAPPAGQTGEEAPPPETAIVPEPPLLSALRAAEFVELEPAREPPTAFSVLPEAGLRVVVVSGPGAVMPDTELLVPLLGRFTEDVGPQIGGPVVVAAQRGPDGDAAPTEDFDPAAERVRFVGPLRTTEGLRDRLSTVDDLELFPGLLAVVFGLQHGAVGQFGHYGVGEGAQSLLPPDPAADGG